MLIYFYYSETILITGRGFYDHYQILKDIGKIRNSDI